MYSRLFVLFTNRTFNHVVRVRRHYSEVGLGRVQLAVQVLVQRVAEHPDPLRRLFVHFQVVGETERGRITGQHALRNRPEFPVRVPAAHLSVDHQVVVHHALRVHGHAGRLARSVSGAPGVAERREMFEDVAGAKRRVPQRRGGHVELVIAGQRVEVQHPAAGVARVRRQAHPENSVHPIEL